MKKIKTEAKKNRERERELYAADRKKGSKNDELILIPYIITATINIKYWS